MNTVDVRTTQTHTIRLPAIAVLAALALSMVAAIAIVGGETNAGIFARLGDFLTQVGEAFAGG